MPALQASGLSKFYGAARGIEGFNLEVRPGEIFGFLGPNGAGKTTVIRCALGLLLPTAGEVRLFGDPVATHHDLNHERIGYLPADLRLWRSMTPRRISNLLLRIGPQKPGSLDRRERMARRLELDLDRKIKALSLGNRQKVGLMLAMQHDPELLILDEPTSGLDPLVRRTVGELLSEFAADGGTVIYSSHNLNEVEEICSRVGIMRRGRLVAVETIDEIRAEREQRLQLVFARGGTEPTELSSSRPPELARFAFEKIKGHDRTWQVSFHGSPAPLLRWLAGFEVEDISSPQVSLEEAFLRFYRDDIAPNAPHDPDALPEDATKSTQGGDA